MMADRSPEVTSRPFTSSFGVSPMRMGGLYHGYHSRGDPRVQTGSRVRVIDQRFLPEMPDAQEEGLLDARNRASQEVHQPFRRRNSVLDKPVVDDAREFQATVARLDSVLQPTPELERANLLLEVRDARKKQRAAAEHALWESKIYDPLSKSLVTAVDKHYTQKRLVERALLTRSNATLGTARWDPATLRDHTEQILAAQAAAQVNPLGGTQSFGASMLRRPASVLQTNSLEQGSSDGAEAQVPKASPRRRTSLVGYSEDGQLTSGSQSPTHLLAATFAATARTATASKQRLLMPSSLRVLTEPVKLASVISASMDPGKRSLVKPLEETALVASEGFSRVTVSKLPSARVRTSLIPPSTWKYHAETLSLLRKPVEGRRDKNVSAMGFHDYVPSETLPRSETGRFIDVDKQFPIGKRTDLTETYRRSKVTF